MPGQLIKTLLQDAGFTHFGYDFMEKAKALEDKYSTHTLIRAVETMKIEKKKKEGQGTNGIAYPLEYLTSILSAEPAKPAARPKERFRVLPDQYGNEEKIVEV